MTDPDDDIEAVADEHFEAREAILEHVGFVEGWKVFPLEDSREMYWAVDDNEVKFAPNRADLERWLETDDHSDMTVYSNELFDVAQPPSGERKSVYRGEVLTMIVVDTNTDGNMFLALFRNYMEMSAPDEEADEEETDEPDPLPPRPLSDYSHPDEAEIKIYVDSRIGDDAEGDGRGPMTAYATVRRAVRDTPIDHHPDKKFTVIVAPKEPS